MEVKNENSKIVSILIVLALAFSMLTACAPDPIQTDLKSYINDQIPAVQTLLDQASTAYSDVAGDNYTDERNNARGAHGYRYPRGKWCA